MLLVWYYPWTFHGPVIHCVLKWFEFEFRNARSHFTSEFSTSSTQHYTWNVRGLGTCCPISYTRNGKKKTANISSRGLVSQATMWATKPVRFWAGYCWTCGRSKSKTNSEEVFIRTVTQIWVGWPFSWSLTSRVFAPDYSEVSGLRVVGGLSTIGSLVIPPPNPTEILWFRSALPQPSDTLSPAWQLCNYIMCCPLVAESQNRLFRT